MLAGIMFALISIHASAHFGSKGPFGGSVSCMVTAGDTVYVGTKEGGVYESTTAALVAWRARPVGLKSGKITAVAHTGKYLYAATADSGIFVFNGYNGSDRYWNKVNAGLSNLQITSLIAINAATLMAGTTKGIFITTNGGTSWDAMNGTLHHLDIAALTQTGSRIFMASRDGGIYITENNGASWTAFNDSNTEHINGTIALSYNSVSDELMVLNKNGIFIAASASTVQSPVYTSADADLPSSIAVRFISNNGASWYLATDQGVFASAVSTLSWSASNAGLSTLDVNAVVPFKTGLVCGTQVEGIFKTQLPFTSWSVMNLNFNNLKTTAMLADGVSLLVAATEKGVYVSKDLGANYVEANEGLSDGLYVSDLCMANTYLLAAAENGVYISADTGKQWSSASAGLVNKNIKKIFYSNDKMYAFDSNGDIYTSGLAAINWVQITGNLPSGVKPTSLVFYKNSMLLGTNGQGIFIKSVTEDSWTSYNAGLGSWNVTGVTVLGSKMYAGTDGSGVFVSDTDPASIHWTAASATHIEHTSKIHLNGLKIQAMASYAGYVWASYKGGLLASSDQGATWVEGGNQFNLPSYTDVTEINFVTTRVFVSTENNGLYSNSLAELDPVETGILNASATNTSALLVSPNPNNGSFRLDTKNISGKISGIIIYDYAGNVKDRFSSEQDFYRVDYSHGMYLIQVNTSEDVVYTQKIVIQ